MELVWTTIGAIKAIINSPAYTDQEKVEQINKELARLNAANKKQTTNENIRTNRQ